MTETENWLLDDLAVTVIRTSRRRTLALEVGVEGVKARAPLRMRKRSIVEFIEAKRDWIQHHLSELPPPEKKFEFVHGAELYLAGEPCQISIVEQAKRGQVTVSPSHISIPVIRSHLTLEESARRKLIKHLKQHAKSSLSQRVREMRDEMQIPSRKKLSVSVRDYKRRWGSCDHLGQLSFNWRIICAPADVMDYVVVHELAHCHEFNHSPKFWAIVNDHMPDWKDKQQWLHQYSSRLYRL